MNNSYFLIFYCKISQTHYDHVVTLVVGNLGKNENLNIPIFEENICSDI